MYGTFLVVALVAIPAFAHAESWQETCELTGDLAFDIMQSRQLGAPMRKVLTISDGSILVETMIVEAYATPTHLSRTLQEQVEKDFRDKWFRLCIEDNIPDHSLQ